MEPHYSRYSDTCMQLPDMFSPYPGSSLKPSGDLACVCSPVLTISLGPELVNAVEKLFSGIIRLEELLKQRSFTLSLCMYSAS